MTANLKTFVVHGPFVVPLEPNKKCKMVALDLKAFWHTVGSVRSRRGIYVFALRAGQGIKPVYVGKTERRTFEIEAFTDRNLAHKFNPALLDYAKGTAVMFFVAHPKTHGAINRNLIDELETFLIGVAWQKNPCLTNIYKMPNPKWAIKGVVRAAKGKPTKAETAFRHALGLVE
jgi:hypothetical protein